MTVNNGEPADIMIVHTGKDTARDFSKRRVDRLVNSTKGLKKRFRNKKDVN